MTLTLEYLNKISCYINERDNSVLYHHLFTTKEDCTNLFDEVITSPQIVLMTSDFNSEIGSSIGSIRVNGITFYFIDIDKI